MSMKVALQAHIISGCPQNGELLALLRGLHAAAKESPMKHLFVSWLLALGVASAFAQTNPGYPCQGCAGARPLFDMPSSALWYVVQRPGTGLSITVQDGFLVGVYYGFTGAGKPLWYLFTGFLERTDDAPNRLTLAAPLQRVENGPCLGCAWHPPDYLNSPGNAVLQFDQANHGTLSLNGGEPLDVLPFIAGVGYAQLFPSYTEYAFPDLEGTWVAVQEIPSSDGGHRYASHIGTLHANPYTMVDQRALWTLVESQGPLDHYTILDMDCRFSFGIPGQVDEHHSTQVPDCWLSDVVSAPDSGPEGRRIYFSIPYANIGASRISSIDPETGVRLILYRLEYD
jgi:hypothetical protein